MEFQHRLEKAIERGRRTGESRARAEETQALSEEELRRLHSQYRLPLTEQIENCLRELTNHFPGFRYETIVSDRGWGAAISRDDLQLSRSGRRQNLFSRLELVVRPFSAYHVLELSAKGTIRNKEVFSRNHYQRLAQVDTTSFLEMIDLWVLEFAELFAAQGG
jgi:hypothetical protein